MASLTIKANNIQGASEFEIGYRLAGSGAAFTVITNVNALPYVVDDVPNGQYEVYVKKKCNGVWSIASTGTSAACPIPTRITAIRSGNNISITYTLGPGQYKFDVEITDPNGGVNRVRRSDGNSGVVNIPMGTAIQGIWQVRLRGVCDDTQTPNWVSDYTSSVSVDVLADENTCPQVSGIIVSNIGPNGVSITAVPPQVTANVVAYTARLIPAGGGTPIDTTQNTPSFNVTGLQPSMQYTIQVFTNCQNGGTSNAVSGGTFTTSSVSNNSQINNATGQNIEVFIVNVNNSAITNGSNVGAGTNRAFAVANATGANVAVSIVGPTLNAATLVSNGVTTNGTVVGNTATFNGVNIVNGMTITLS